MKSHPFFTRCLLFFVMSVTFQSVNAQQIIHIGLVNFAMFEKSQSDWMPMVQFLNAQFKNAQVEPHFYTPIETDQLEKDVAEQKLDFVITHPVSLVELSVKFGASPILTLVDTSGHAAFGSAIITRKDSTITQLDQIRNKTIAGASPLGFGGWLIGIDHIKTITGKDPRRINTSLFLGAQENIVKAVIEGQADVGIIRTGILEKMVRLQPNLKNSIRVLTPNVLHDFDYQISTNIFPEWGLLKLNHTADALSKKIVLALLQIPPNSPILNIKGFYEWITTVDYQPVHELMKRLQVGVYQDYGKINLAQYIKTHTINALTVVILMLAVLMSLIWSLHLNRQLKDSKFRIEKQHQLVLNSVKEGVYGIDLKGNCTFINQSFQHTMGWNISDTLGKNMHQLMHHTRINGQSHPPCECPVYITTRDGKPRNISHDIFWTKSGENIDVEYSVSPVKNQSQEIIGSVVVFKDITQRILREQHFKKLNEEVEHLNRLNTLSELVSGLSHELNQPLTSIQTRAFALKHLFQTHQQSQCNDLNKVISQLDIIQEQANFGGQIIQQLRQFSKKQNLPIETLNLNEHIKKIRSLLMNQIRTDQIKVQLSVAENFVLMAQPTQFDQVLLNLMKNAMEALEK